MSSKRLYSAEELADAIQAATKTPDKFLTADDVNEIASELGVPVEAVRRELDHSSPKLAQVPGLALERSAGDVRLTVSPPGFRAPIATQFLVALTAASVTLYWLRTNPYWAATFGLIWAYWICRVVSLAYRRTLIHINQGRVEISAIGWLSDERHRFERPNELELEVKKSGERMLIEFFPTYYLEVRGDGERGAILEGYDIATLDAVRGAIMSSMQHVGGVDSGNAP